jgi:hypothetical protein
MGEYAIYKGEQIKMGTCEDMYYLRYDQRHQVTPERGSVNPVTDAGELRFRFPWPDEDAIEPGSGKFHDNGYHRSLAIHGMGPTTDVDHGHVQFVAQAGYNVCLPCPESAVYQDEAKHGARVLGELRVHRNGFSGSVHLVAQKYRPGIGLVPILRCGGCGTMWRLEERDKIDKLAVMVRAEGDRNTGNSAFWHRIADRILAGLSEP